MVVGTLPNGETSKGELEKMTSKSVVIAYWNALHEHRLNDVLDLLAPDFVSYSTLSRGRPVSKEMAVKGIRVLEKALPELREELGNVLADGDRVACELTESATLTGPLGRPTGVVAPTNRAYRLPVAAFFRVNAQELISELRTSWDVSDRRHQMDVDPRLFIPLTSPTTQPG